MDSLNMNNLASSLPSSTIAKAEQDTMDKFRAAAQSLTLLYRSSQKASKRHFDAGYATALEDLLSVIQHGVSAGPDPSATENGGSEGISIGRILDWIEARQETIRLKAREEEEEEEERDLKNRPGSSSKALAGMSGSGDPRDKVIPKSSVQKVSSSPTTSAKRLSGRQTSDRPAPVSTMAHESSPSPTLPSASMPQGLSVSHPSSSRPQTRARLRSQQAHAPLSATTLNTPNSTPNSGSSMASILGAKRRHAAMLLDTYPPAPVSVSFPPSELRGAPTSLSIVNGPTPHQSDGFAISGSTGPGYSPGQRRRTRHLRAGATPRIENVAFADGNALVNAEMMDVEDDNGRERKRVARR